MAGGLSKETLIAIQEYLTKGRWENLQSAMTKAYLAAKEEAGAYASTEKERKKADSLHHGRKGEVLSKLIQAMQDCEKKEL